MFSLSTLSSPLYLGLYVPNPSLPWPVSSPNPVYHPLSSCFPVFPLLIPLAYVGAPAVKTSICTLKPYSSHHKPPVQFLQSAFLSPTGSNLWVSCFLTFYLLPGTSSLATCLINLPHSLSPLFLDLVSFSPTPSGSPH